MPSGDNIVIDENGIRRPEYVYSRFKPFLSRWAEAALRAERARYQQALEEIAAEEDDERAALIARQALLDDGDQSDC